MLEGARAPGGAAFEKQDTAGNSTTPWKAMRDKWAGYSVAIPVRLLVIAALLGLVAAEARSATSPLTPEEQQALIAYGELPSFSELTLSPDGSRVAYIGTVGAERHMLVKSLADGQKLADFTEGKGQKLRSLQWAGNDHILTKLSMTLNPFWWGVDRDEYFGVIATDLKTGKAWDVLEFPGGAANNAGRFNLASGRVRVREIGGEIWLFMNGFFYAGDTFGGEGRLMKINLVKRTHAIIESRDVYRQYGRVLDEAGNVVAASDYDSEHRRWKINVGAGGQLKTALSGAADLDIPHLIGLSPDGKDVWLLTWVKGVSAPGSYSLADGKPTSHEQLRAGAHPEDWEGALIEERNDRIVAGVIHGSGGNTYEFLDPKVDAEWQAVIKALGGMRPTFISSSDEFRRVIVRVLAPNGPLYLLVDMAAATLTTLGPEYRQLPALAEVRALEYAAGDGLAIPAYLTLPAGRPAKGLPLVVLPHGGPEARDSGGFDWWAQALANEGYAVLQPNFRGSAVSDAFVVAGHGEFGRKMQTDLSDGVRYLQRQGIIDPARVCIAGASYGDYAALAGITLQHDIYRCAVSVAGISDLHRMVEPKAGVRTEANYGARYWERWLGVTDVDDPSVDERSPLRHVDAVQVPLLLIHGKDDMVVPYEQSRWMAEALRGLHKPVDLIDLKSEDHWLSHSQTRVQMLAQVVTFLKANNPP